jgi:Putative zinc-finger
MPPACADTRRRLADLVRDSISARGLRRLDAHLLTCASCREARDELERFNQHLRTAPGLPLTAGAGIMQIGLKPRILGALSTSSASLVAASGCCLIVVSTVVPLLIAPHRASGDDRVAAVAERGVPATTITAAPPEGDTDPGAGDGDPTSTAVQAAEAGGRDPGGPSPGAVDPGQPRCSRPPCGVGCSPMSRTGLLLLT